MVNFERIGQYVIQGEYIAMRDMTHNKWHVSRIHTKGTNQVLEPIGHFYTIEEFEYFLTERIKTDI